MEQIFMYVIPLGVFLAWLIQRGKREDSELIYPVSKSKYYEKTHNPFDSDFQITTRINVNHVGRVYAAKYEKTLDEKREHLYSEEEELKIKSHRNDNI